MPLKNKSDFNFNLSFSIFNNTRIFGTKDDIISNNVALSALTTYEKFTFYGLNLGGQYPVFKKDSFVVMLRADAWVSPFKFDAISSKIILGYKF